MNAAPLARSVGLEVHGWQAPAKRRFCTSDSFLNPYHRFKPGFDTIMNHVKMLQKCDLFDLLRTDRDELNLFRLTSLFRSADKLKGLATLFPRVRLCLQACIC